MFSYDLERLYFVIFFSRLFLLAFGFLCVPGSQDVSWLSFQMSPFDIEYSEMTFLASNWSSEKILTDVPNANIGDVRRKTTSVHKMDFDIKLLRKNWFCS